MKDTESHTHCKVCERPIPMDEDFCSQKCREDYDEMIGKRKKRMYILYGLLAVFLVVLLLRMFWG